VPIIHINTSIAASPVVVFDLSRSIDLHLISTAQTDEEAVAGKTSGLIGMGEWVTWRARHFGCTQELTSRITAFNRPHSFVDEMEKGAFERFSHTHTFDLQADGTTIMTDLFDYTSPLGLLGRLADFLFLKKYMRGLLEKRNAIIKECAEGEGWRALLDAED